MKRLPLVVLSLLLAFMVTAAAQNKNTNTSTGSTATNANKGRTRGPIFRATADQIKQAQAILKQRTFYGGEQTGKLDTDTRSGLKKYQSAEGLKATGTLNKVTLEKMSIALTDKQRTM